MTVFIRCGVSLLRMRMRTLLPGLLLWLALPAFASTDVQVGAYHFPPYMIKPESAAPVGLVPDLLAALNQLQTQYRFVLVATSTMRRYRDLESGRFDLILFESPQWGWQDTAHAALDLHIEDAEVYVARRLSGRNQGYFDQLKGKRMALYSGYHYGFANFNADQEFLTEEFGALLTYSHDNNLTMLLRDRADIAVITRSYLHLYQDRHPRQSADLLVSERVDQVYRHQVLFRPQAPLSPEVFADLLQTLNRDGQLDRLLSRYHLERSAAAASN
jgi:ABC-type amino acid transport substrate-binding protein